MRARDITNQKFNKLTAKYLIESKVRKWFCECDCGNTKIVLQSSLTKNNIVSCGCMRSGMNNPKFTGYKEISGKLWGKILSGAKSRNLEVSIDIEYIYKLFLTQNKKCALSGVDISFGLKEKDYTSASLDRIDSSKGYIEGNVQWVHKNVNLMKMDLSENYFIETCKKIGNLKRISRKYINDLDSLDLSEFA